MDPKLLDALTQVLDDVGLPRAANPAVTRGALTDLVADDARAWRGDIDALVLAAEEGVTDAVASGDGASIAAVSAALVERGVDPAVAGEAIEAWRSALGATGTAPAGPLGAAAAMLGGNTVESDVPTAPQPPPVDGTVLPVEPKAAHRQKVLVAAAIVAFVALLGGAVAFAASRGGDDEAAVVVDDTTVVTAPDTTTSTDTTTVDTTTSTDTTVPPETPAPETPAPETPSPGPAPGPGPSPQPPIVTPPPPTPPPPPSDPTPTAVSTNVTWTPQYAGGWYTADFSITYNVTTPWDQIQVGGLTTGHGTLTTSGSTGYFTPHHNGYFTDSFSYRLKYGNSAWSNWATVYLTVYCNTAYACY